MCPQRHILFLIVYFHRSYPAGVLRILVVVGSTPTEVERRDTNHLVIGQCEIKDADILYHPLFVHGLGNDHHATLKVRTLSIAAAYFKGQFSTNYALMTAGCVILIVPQLLIFTVFQRFIIDGVTAGAVKG